MNKINYRDFEFQSAKLESDEPVVVSCPKTNVELYFTTGSDQIYAFESFGECVECHLHVHVSALQGNISPSEWPIQYLGYFCKDCYFKSDEEVELTKEEEKLIQQMPEDEEEE